MKDLLGLILACVVFWGLWGFLSKLSSQRIGMQVTLWYAIAYASTIIGFLLLSSHVFPIKKDSVGIILAIAAGMTGALASLFFFFLLQRKPAGYLVAVTSLYPVITLFLSVLFLQEALGLIKVLGIFLAILALFLLSL